jgi:hypothetical protein
MTQPRRNLGHLPSQETPLRRRGGGVASTRVVMLQLPFFQKTSLSLTLAFVHQLHVSMNRCLPSHSLEY